MSPKGKPMRWFNFDWQGIKDSWSSHDMSFNVNLDLKYWIKCKPEHMDVDSS